MLLALYDKWRTLCSERARFQFCKRHGMVQAQMRRLAASVKRLRESVVAHSEGWVYSARELELDPDGVHTAGPSSAY